MDEFLKQWGEVAFTTAGFFWMALWAFLLGYMSEMAPKSQLLEKHS
jgi:hypothetical protein